MSQSTATHERNRVLLLQQGREFDEFDEVLSDLAVPTDIRTGPFPSPAEIDDACLVIVSGKRLLQTGTPDLRCWPRTFAVIDDASNTLVSQLNRIGVSMVIRRPVHPRALRLLLLHEIYRGPERRDRKRVLVGHPIRIGSGLFKSRAILLELSPSGARIETAHPPKVGSEVQVLIGRDLTRGRPLRFHGRVVRSIRPRSGNPNRRGEVGLRILDARQHADALQAVLDRFALGPARWKPRRHDRHVEPAKTPPRAGTERSPADPRPPTPARAVESETTPGNQIAPAPMTTTAPLGSAEAIPSSIDPTDPMPLVPDDRESDLPQRPDREHPETERVEDLVTTDADEDAKEPDDRRRAERVAYDERIVALDREASRVLVGRDLSIGGMRIARNPSVAIGDVLRVALHDGTDADPLLVLARARRDDGEAGIVLTFEDPSPIQRDRIAKIIAASAAIHSVEEAAGDAEEGPASIVVGEMIERIRREDDPERAIG